MKALIAIVSAVKRVTGLRTWQVEACFVAGALGLVAYFGNTRGVHLIGVLAVFFTWLHMSVANSLATGAVTGKTVECHYKLTRYAVAKEICWAAYFIVLSAYPALFGCLLFIGYAAWRRAWDARSV